MRHYILTLLLLLGSLTVSAQEAATTAAPPQAAVLSFGYFSYKAVMEQMPEYATAQRTLSTLRAKYDVEMKRVEDEFNMKYEQFLEGQHDFAPSILQKRQAELQDLMQKNQAFKKQTEQLLRQAEDDTYAPLHRKIQQAVQLVGQSHQYAFILNTDDNAAPYINPSMGVNVSQAILQAIQ